MKKLHISTLGCKVNQYESSVIAEQFKALGYEFTDSLTADVYVINTCTVTNRTDYKSRNLIRKALQAKALNPLVKVFVTGCYAQRNLDEIKAMGDIDLIIDNQFKTDVYNWLDSLDYRFLDIMQAQSFHYIPTSSMLEHTRAFQKIQDGCDFYCSYCAVPYARGHSRSCTFADVQNQARILVANDYREIVLGGVNLGLYHDGDKDLGDVLIALDKIEDLHLIRLSSIEPQLLSLALLDTMQKVEKLCPHFHIPLQSGSDTVLKRMGRRYRTEDVEKLVQAIRLRFPSAAIGMDVITAFPAESEAEYQDTYHFIQSLALAYLHVFTYSKRKGTPAAAMPMQIHGEVANHRTHQLSELGNQKKLQYMEDLIHCGCTLRGVAEETINGISSALSDHYIRIYTDKEVSKGELFSITAKTRFEEGLGAIEK